MSRTLAPVVNGGAIEGSTNPPVAKLCDLLILGGKSKDVLGYTDSPVQSMFFDASEFAAVVKPGFKHQMHSQAGFLRRLRWWKRVPVLGAIIPAGVIGYQAVRQEVREQLRSGVPETADDGATREERLLRGVEKAGVPVRDSSEPVWMSPQFISSSVVILRSKLGRMEPTEPNRHVAARSYAKMCRDNGVRLSVQEQNRRMVMEAFFKDDTMDRIADRHAVPPFWMRLVCGASLEASLAEYDA